jgi:dynein assembly factor 5
MEKVGTFISPETTMSLILPALSGSGGSSSTFRIGCLRALQGVLRGSSSKSLESHLPKILSCLSDRDLVQNESVPVIVELAKCFGEIGKKLSNDPTVLFQYFFVLVHLESFPGDSKVTGWTGLMESVNTALIDHAFYLGVPLDSLYLTHFNQGIHVLSETFSNWNQYSYEPKVLKTLLYKGGKKVGENFDKLIPIFAECTKLEKDFELREA